MSNILGKSLIPLVLAAVGLAAVSLTGCGKKAELKEPLPEIVHAQPESTEAPKPAVKDTLGTMGILRGVQALQDSIRVAKTPRERDSLRVLLARAFSGFREYRSSGAAYDSVSPSGPWADEALFEGGRAYLLDQQYSPGLRMLLAGRNTFPQEAKTKEVGLLVGYAYEGLDQYSQAREEYQSLIASGSPLEDYARFHLGVVDRKAGRKAEGTRILESLAAQGSGSPVAVLARAELASGRRGRAKRVVKMPPLPATPDTSREAKLRGGYSRAMRLMKRGNYPAAIRAFSRVAKAGGSRGAEARYYAGRCYEFMDDLPHALESYQEARNQGPRSGIANDAQWRAGLVHFKLGQCDEAVQDWGRLLSEHPGSQFYEESAFWSGRCLERRGETARALAAYRRVEEEDPFQYYAFKARERIVALDTTQADPLGSDTLTTREWLGEWSRDLSLDSARWAGTLKRPYVQRGLILLRDGFLKEGAMELAPLEQEYRMIPYALWQLGKLYAQAGADSRAIWCGRRILRLAPSGERPKVTREVIALMYPVCYAKTLLEQVRKWKVDPAFALGIIREESRFRARDVSRTGARGLMQVMPKTGKKIARELDLPFNVGDLFDPYTSLAYGVYYLSSVRKDVGDQKELIAAGYNAGPMAVVQWTAARSPKDIEAFIEDIPYLETREYVKAVLGSTWTYEQRLQGMGKGS